MKKLLFIFMIGILAVSCGPSAKELEEKRIADSTRVADSLVMVQIENQRLADSISQANYDKCVADSLEACAKKCSKKTK